MRKEIKKWGDSAVITLTKEDLKLHKLKIKDVVKIEIKKIKYNIKGKLSSRKFKGKKDSKIITITPTSLTSI